MAGGGRGRRTYVRDGRGRFASTGTTTAKAKPAARRAQRGTNRLTRDNSGRITGAGKNGATARGGRLRTAAGNQRGAVLDRMKRAPMAGTVGRGGKARGAQGAAKAKSVKLSASQRMVAQRARDTFKDDTLLLNGRIAKGYKEGVQAIQQKFGVNNRIATHVFMKKAFRMGTSDIQYVDPARAKKTIKALRATRDLGSPIGGSSRRAKAAAIPSTVPRGRRKAAAAKLAAPKQVQAARPSGTIRKPQGLKPGALAQKAGAKGGKGPSGVKAIPKGELKRYRMLQNKIRPLRESLDRDGSTMVGSADRERTSRASARYSQNLRKLRRITDTMRRLSNSPETPNIPRLPVVASTGARLGRTAAVKRMDGPRRFGGQSFRDLRGQYTDGQVQYEDNYMNKLYKRKDKGSTVKGPKLGGVVRKGAAKPGTTPEALGAISRSRSQAKAAQRNRREQVLDRGRTGVTGLGRMRRNPRIRATDTGMRQLSLVGKPKKLKRYKPVK